MNTIKPYLIRLLFVTAIFLPLITNVDWSLIQYRKAIKYSKDNTSEYVDKVEKLKQLLINDNIIGYYSNRTFSEADDFKYFYLTQYALAPTVITKNLQQQILFANVDEAFNIEDFCRSNNLLIIKSFDDGIMLFKKRSE